MTISYLTAFLVAITITMAWAQSAEDGLDERQARGTYVAQNYNTPSILYNNTYLPVFSFVFNLIVFSVISMEHDDARGR